MVSMKRFSKIQIILAMTFLMPCGLHAQMNLSFSMGYASFSMADFKVFQKELVADFPVSAKITESFPSYWYYEGGINKIVSEKFILGLNLGYGSTGGRIHYEDYSGEIGANQLLHYISAVSALGIHLNPEVSSYSVTIDAKPTVSYNTFTLEYMARIGNQIDKDEVKFNSINFAFQPTLMVSKNIKMLSIGIGLGYYINVYSGKTYWSEDSNAYLLNNRNEEVKINWSGFRLSTSLSFRIYTEE